MVRCILPGVHSMVHQVLCIYTASFQLHVSLSGPDSLFLIGASMLFNGCKLFLYAIDILPRPFWPGRALELRIGPLQLCIGPLRI